jgi:SAM-dependent methyltransferase
MRPVDCERAPSAVSIGGVLNASEAAPGVPGADRSVGAIMGDNQPPWAPSEVDRERPNASRVYDFLLGGSHNFDIDRDLGRRVLEAEPNARLFAQANRNFLRRAVRFLIGAGVRQFLDVGSGIPTLGNTHEVAQREAPDARVVYVDIDPVAVAHSAAILNGNDRAGATIGDLREPGRILADPVVRQLIDPDEPVGLLLVAVLHFVPDADNPVGVVAQFRDALVPGSFVVVSHASSPASPEAAGRVARVRDAYQHAATPLTLRSRKEIGALVEGWELVVGGVVDPAAWLTEPGTGPGFDVPGFAVVGKKP